MPTHADTERNETEIVEDAPRNLSPAAQRALAEAAERRRIRDSADGMAESGQKVEIGGRGGPEPVRYGDWEKGGIAWDF